MLCLTVSLQLISSYKKDCKIINIIPQFNSPVPLTSFLFFPRSFRDCEMTTDASTKSIRQLQAQQCIQYDMHSCKARKWSPTNCQSRHIRTHVTYKTLMQMMALTIMINVLYFCTKLVTAESQHEAHVASNGLKDSTMQTAHKANSWKTIHTWASVSVPRECCFSSDFSSPCSSDTLRWSCSISACWQSASSFSSTTHPFSLHHLKESQETPDSKFLLDLQKWISNCEMVGWSLTSLFSTNMAISETILTVRIQEPYNTDCDTWLKQDRANKWLHGWQNILRSVCQFSFILTLLRWQRYKYFTLYHSTTLGCSEELVS